MFPSWRTWFRDFEADPTAPIAAMWEDLPGWDEYFMIRHFYIYMWPVAALAAFALAADLWATRRHERWPLILSSIASFTALLLVLGFLNSLRFEEHVRPCAAVFVCGAAVGMNAVLAVIAMGAVRGTA
jgi:hypothetical protein